MPRLMPYEKCTTRNNNNNEHSTATAPTKLNAYLSLNAHREHVVCRRIEMPWLALWCAAHRTYYVLHPNISFASFTLNFTRWNNECINLHFNPMHSHHSIATFVLRVSHSPSLLHAQHTRATHAHGPAVH